MTALEHKFISLGNVGISTKAEAGGPVIVSGYASTFGGEADSYGDVIDKGAYAATIADWALRTYAMPMLINHDGLPVGKWPALGMKEDGRGLYVEGELTPGHPGAAAVEASLRHGAISGLSIGFRTKAVEMREDGIRVLKQIDLREISIVGSPANETARVTGVKSDLTIREFEDFLCETLRWPRGMAKAVAAEGFKAGANLRMRRDAEGANPGTGRETTGKDEPRDGADEAKALLADLQALRQTLPPSRVMT